MIGKTFSRTFMVLLLTFRYVFVKKQKDTPALQLNWGGMAAIFRLWWQNIQVQRYAC